jgi:hypothetical protein
MCMFCVAVPATLVAGISGERRQRDEREAALARGESPSGRAFPIRQASLGLTAFLICGSILYHTHVPF